jgi:cobalt-zinc-cadmium efflux system outer membrane protein
MKQSIILIFFLIGLHAHGQPGVDSVLRSVETNNRSIQSNKKYQEARRAEFKTGLTPYDPQVEYDYLFGSPAGAGDQRDFSITQRLDFPTTYKAKRDLSKEQILQTDLHFQVYRQDILLDAKLIALEIIYYNKKGNELAQRRENTRKLVEDYQKKLDKGDVIILDVNKAKLQLLNIENEVAFNNNAKQIALTRLSSLNGGMTVDLRDTTYPATVPQSDFASLDSAIEANDPVLKTYQQEIIIQQQQIAVQRALNLPKIETGYHSQGILGQSYRGIHAGISIPLWENKNRLHAAKADLEFLRMNAVAHVLSHRLENQAYYEQLAVRVKAMNGYQELLSTLNNRELLNKALALGQITIIQYFQDESYYFSAYDKYLQMELEYHQALARLFKYQL